MDMLLTLTYEMVIVLRCGFFFYEDGWIRRAVKIFELLKDYSKQVYLL